MTIYYTGSAAIGGGVGTFEDPFTLQELADTATPTDEGRILNDGTYTPSAKIDFDTNTGGIIIRGRNAGDTADELVTISGSSLPTTTDLFQFNGEVGRNYKLFDIRLTAAKRYNVYVDHKDNSSIYWYRCRFDNADQHGVVPGNSWQFYHCEIDNNGSLGIFSSSNASSSVQVMGCSVHDNVSTGIFINSAGCRYQYNLFYDNGGDGLRTENNGGLVIGNVFDGNTSDGFSPDGGTSAMFAINNIFSNNGAYGVNLPASLSLSAYMDYNHYYNNAIDETDLGATPGDNNTNGNPLFVSRADGSEDYRLQVGSPCLGVGFPGTFPTGAGGAGAMDIGALQRAADGGLLTHPGMAGGMRG